MTFAKIVYWISLQLLIVSNLARTWEREDSKTTAKPTISLLLNQNDTMINSNVTSQNKIERVNNESSNKGLDKAVNATSMQDEGSSKLRGSKKPSKSVKDVTNGKVQRALNMFLRKPNKKSRETLLNVSREYYDGEEGSSDCAEEKENCNCVSPGNHCPNESKREIIMDEFNRAINDYICIHLSAAHIDELALPNNTVTRLSEVRELLNATTKFTEHLKSFIAATKSPNLMSFEVMKNMSDTLDIRDWEIQLRDFEHTLEMIKEIEFRMLVKNYIQPVFQGIVFVLGFAFNGALLVVFVKHRDMRTSPNMMLINLVVGDMLNLLINIIALYPYLYSSWEMGRAMCKFYCFLRGLCRGVCVYSVVFISVQRYLALTRFEAYSEHGFKMSNTLKVVLAVTSVWVISTIVAVTRSTYAGIDDNVCINFHEDISKVMRKVSTSVDFIALCVMPAIIVPVFSVLSSKKLKTSVRIIPGEASGMERIKRGRILSSKILIALSVVFVFSYGPYFTLKFLFDWNLIKISMEVEYVSFHATYMLLFAYACFNPVALYLVCGKLRKKVNLLFSCRNGKNTAKNNNEDSNNHPYKL